MMCPATLDASTPKVETSLKKHPWHEKGESSSNDDGTDDSYPLKSGRKRITVKEGKKSMSRGSETNCVMGHSS